MPELPEVETVRRGLQRWVIGKKLKNIQALHPRVQRPDSWSPITSLEGAKVTGINRRGKFLWFDFKKDFVLVAHLGMSGQLIVQKNFAEVHPHMRAKFLLGNKDNISKNEIKFIDQRTFGWLSVEILQGGVPTSVKKIAFDPFEQEFDLSKVITTINRRKCAIKPAILNQNIISGIGNIYADEALWRAKIHPEIICEDLSVNEIRKVISSAKKVMAYAIKAGGTSFDEQYKNVNGESGYFSRSLKVYGRAGKKCPRCANTIQRIPFANRSSHFCPRCQR